ncbi:MAG: translation initiation factor IF-2, partial [Patescibacteria group bacterium]
AEKIEVPVNKVVAELMNNGILATLNERVDFDTAAIIAEDLGLLVAKETVDRAAAVEEDKDLKLKNLLAAGDAVDLRPRPPVVVVMGHVDHGKTKLLDAIRHTDVVAGEHGGITQHIGAYQITRQGRAITFIDTPGHEAFSAMRSRGAKVADIAILVVAADDSIKPQTVEAIQIIQAVGLPFVVAINKIDKPDADIERVKSDLAQRNLLPEDWGGQVICVPISAKAGTNIEQLLDMVLLAADLDPSKMMADPSRLAVGTVIEAHKDPGEGAVATVLIQSGTLRPNDVIGINSELYGRVRAMKDWNGQDMTAATPGTPVKVLGWKVEPAVGDVLEITTDQKTLTVPKNKKARTGAVKATIKATSEDDAESPAVKTLNIVLKSDVLGSAEAIAESLEKLEIPAGVNYKIITRGLGNVTEADILRGEGDGALVIGFNVSVAPTAQLLARDKGVKVHLFKIIYELLDLVKDRLNTMVDIELKEIDLGQIKVLAIFKTDKTGQVVGGAVTDGKVAVNTKARLLRDGLDLDRLAIVGLQSGKQEVQDVEAGAQCGLKITGKLDVRLGDILEVYREEKVIRQVK